MSIAQIPIRNRGGSAAGSEKDLSNYRLLPHVTRSLRDYDDRASGRSPDLALILCANHTPVSRNRHSPNSDTVALERC